MKGWEILHLPMLHIMRVRSTIRSFAVPILLTIGLLSGCASRQTELKKILREPLSPSLGMEGNGAEVYTVSFPDRLRIEFADNPSMNGIYAISPDCRLPGSLQNMSVRNCTAAQVRQNLAQATGYSADRMIVRVEDFRSRLILVHGAINGGTRHVDYRGPETVLQLLERIGGLTADADLRQIFVIRSNVAAGETEQRFEVDLEAIFMKGNPLSNIGVQPNDEIYIGENRRANLAKILPYWMMPIYHKIRGWIPGVRDTQPEAK